MWDIEYRFGGNNGMDLLEKLIGDKGRILQLRQWKVKVVFIWRSIQSSGPLKALYTFCPPWQTCSFRHQLGFDGKHSSQAAITHQD